MKKIKRISMAFASILMAICCSLSLAGSAFADSFSVSPMNEKIALVPGETYYGSLTVNNPADSGKDFTFITEVSPFSNADDTGSVNMEAYKNYSMMTDWITIIDGKGTIAPNETQTVHYTIDVPLDAPAGGQYASILVKSSDNAPVEGSINIQQRFQIAYLIYAEVAGETIHDGSIDSAKVPGFLFSGKIGGTSTVTNKGNTHVSATYKLQVFPLFSNEEIYTNEENPDTALIMPEATILKNTSWDGTPSVGIFNVVYTVEFEGQTTEVKKMVIVCPIWLLILILAAICAIIVWIVSKTKSRKKAQKK